MARDLFDETVGPDALDALEYGKLRFVEEKLAPMVFAATHGIVFSCEYRKSALAPVEAVFMKARFGVGQGSVVEFRADVTADSLWAIAKDVMAAVARQYE